MPDDKPARPADDEAPDLSRRELIRLSAGGALLAAASVAACSKRSEPPAPPVSPDVVRVVSVPTAVEGNLLPTLIATFEAEARYKVALTSTDDPYRAARDGRADIVISHDGHRDAEAFVMEGLGEWPRTLFSNQMALLGPPEDPAKVRNLQDAGEAFRRIAMSKSLYVVNHIDGVRYLTEVLWNAAGRPDRTGWLVDEDRRKDEAIRYASERGGYSFWGLTPFLRLRGEGGLKLEPLVVADPLLQRMLVSVVVNPASSRGVNHDGSLAFQTFLIAPATQARIREVRYPGAESVQWVPGGRHNRTAILPRG